MTTNITIPTDLWDEDQEAVITSWLASAGSRVAEGALLAEIMTAKVQYEILATASGTLVILKEQDEVVAKGDVIGQIT